MSFFTFLFNCTALETIQNHLNMIIQAQFGATRRFRSDDKECEEYSNL